MRLTAAPMACEWFDDSKGYAWDYGLSSITQQTDIWLDVSLSAYDDEPLWVHGSSKNRLPATPIKWMASPGWQSVRRLEALFFLRLEASCVRLSKVVFVGVRHLDDTTDSLDNIRNSYSSSVVIQKAEIQIQQTLKDGTTILLLYLT